MTSSLIFLVVCIAICSYLPRALPFLSDASTWPPLLKRALRDLPVAMVAGITIPPLLYNSEQGWQLHTDNIQLLASLPTLLSAVLFRNMLITISVGFTSICLAFFWQSGTFSW